MLPAALLEEVLEQVRDILAPVSERQHVQVDHVEPVEQILPERPRRDVRREVAVRRGEHANVDAGVRAVGADALQLAGFEESKQRRLHAQAHLADLVEEHGAVVGRLEDAGLVPIGAGEAAPDVPEQLGLEQRVGDARTVERDQACQPARASLMDQCGDDLLADAGLSGDEHLCIRTGREVDLVVDRSHHAADANQVGHGSCPLLMLAAIRDARPAARPRR